MSSPSNTTANRDESCLVIVSLGSNLELADKATSSQILDAAFDALQALSSEPIRRSSIYRTEPVDCPAGAADFLNAIAILQQPSSAVPMDFLTQLHSIEAGFGRRRTRQQNEPRTLDLDLIAWGALVCEAEELVLPHPRAALRRFVLEPLNELLPEFLLPGSVMSVRELLHRSPKSPSVQRLGTTDAH